MKEILVETLMSSEVNCLSADTSLRQAAEQMVERRISCIIIKQDKSPIGILTERDLVKVLCSNNHEQDLHRPISGFMTSPVLSLNQNESLFDALVFNRAERVRHLPVVNDNDELVGLVTQSDLANAHFHVTELQTQLIEQAIASKTQVLQQVNEELQALSMEDHLMDIGNRRAMEVDLNHTHAGAIRHDQNYSILLLDIDYFKRYNDHYGHQMGDDALKQVASILKQQIRASDRLYRYGGEELLLLLPHSSLEQAALVADKLVKSIHTSSIPHKISPLGCITISGGCASVEKHPGEKYSEWEQVVEEADRALYQAKNNGRNCAEISYTTYAVLSKKVCS